MFSPSSHVFSSIFLHFNWHCHANLPMLGKAVEEFVHTHIREYCDQTKGLWFKGMGGTDDHVHLVLQVEAFICPSDVVGKLKGSSAHEANRLFGDGALKWQRGYGVVSFAERDLPAVLRYVANQREHHGRGTVRKVLENWGYDEGREPC